jgi:hypothetical protein
VNVSDLVSEVEIAGVAFQLDGEKVHVEYLDDKHREELAGRIACLRAHRDEVINFLKEREGAPPMPDGVRLIRWRLKRPPVAIMKVEIVTDVPAFVKVTLRQLQCALVGKLRLPIHRSVRELTERLEECGVAVEIDGTHLNEPAS